MFCVLKDKTTAMIVIAENDLVKAVKSYACYRVKKFPNQTLVVTGGGETR